MVTIPIVKEAPQPPETCRPRYMNIHEIVRGDGTVELSIWEPSRVTPPKKERCWRIKAGTDQKGMSFESQDRWIKFQLLRNDNGELSAEVTELVNPWRKEA